MDQKELELRFARHTVDEDQAARGVAIRDAGLTLADLITATTPECREQSLAITALEEAVFWANAAIARRDAR